MPPKSATMLGMVVGSTIGGYVPTFFGVSFLSMWSLLGTLIGGIFGIWLAFRLFR